MRITFLDGILDPPNVTQYTDIFPATWCGGNQLRVKLMNPSAVFIVYITMVILRTGLGGIPELREEYEGK